MTGSSPQLARKARIAVLVSASLAAVAALVRTCASLTADAFAPLPGGAGHQRPQAIRLRAQTATSSGVAKARWSPDSLQQQLLRRLQATTSSNDLLRLVEENAKDMQQEHVGQAFRSLSKANLNTDDPRFLLLLDMAAESMTSFRASALTNVLWALAKVDHHPGDEFMKDAITESLRKVAIARPEDLVNTLWACARLDYHPGHIFIQVVIEKSGRQLGSFGPSNIAHLLWSCAKLEFMPGQHLLEDATRVVSKRLRHFKSADLTQTMWAWARLKHRPPVDVTKAMLERIEAYVDDIDAHFLASTFWACTKMGVTPTKSLMQELAKKPAKEIAVFRPRGLAYVLYIYGKLGYNPGMDFIEDAFERLGRTVPAFGYTSPRDMSGLLWTCNKLGYNPGEKRLVAMERAILNLLPESDPSELSTYLWGFVQLGHRPSKGFFPAWLDRAKHLIGSFSKRDRSMSRAAAQRLGFAGGVTLFQSTRASA